MQGKIVFISGGGRGIGRAAVSLFAGEGAKVAFCARTEGERLGVEKEVKASGGTVWSFPVDIASQRDVHRMISQIGSEWGRIDLLINNAGVLGTKSSIATYPPLTWDEVIRININGTFYLTQAVIRGMIPKRSGCILSISSSVGRKGRADWGAYAVSKFALEGMMQTLAEEVEKYGIRIITLNPEATRTGMRAKAYPDENPEVLKDPSEVAKILLALATDTNPALHGKSMNVSDIKGENR